jgi:predicted Zn-dependent protease with MMP-like domain
MNISNEQFEDLVNEALESLPQFFKDKLHNVAITIDDKPTTEQLKKIEIGRDSILYGLFEGYAQSRRLNFGVVLPDKITIFRQAILKYCNSEEEIRDQIFSTVKHEVAHHFGSDEAGARRATIKNK